MKRRTFLAASVPLLTGVSSSSAMIVKVPQAKLIKSWSWYWVKFPILVGLNKYEYIWVPGQYVPHTQPFFIVNGTNVDVGKIEIGPKIGTGPYFVA